MKVKSTKTFAIIKKEKRKIISTKNVWVNTKPEIVLKECFWITYLLNRSRNQGNCLP